MKDILGKVAEKNGVTRDEVEIEIKRAIEEAMKSQKPEAKRFWKEVAPDGQTPSVETVIALIAEKVNERMCS